MDWETTAQQLYGFLNQSLTVENGAVTPYMLCTDWVS